MISVFSTYEDGLDERFRDILQLDHQTGSLTITNISTEHTGLSKLSVMLSDKESTKRFSVAVHGELCYSAISFFMFC